MSKIKTFYSNNRIFCILMAVSLSCLALIAALLVIYFVSQTKTDEYGSRLNGIESVKITDKHKEEIVNNIKESEYVSKVVVNIKGKIIYINVYLKDGKVSDAENMAIKSLDVLTADEKEYYDINFAFAKENDETFPIMGYKKNDAKLITWTKASGE